MFIVKASRGSKAPLGAACHEDTVARRSVPLLTELETGSVGWPFYKHGAPSGALANAARCTTLFSLLVFLKRFWLCSTICG